MALTTIPVITHNSSDPELVTTQLRIAIIGGGIAGAAAALTLSRLPNVQLTVYEQAPVVREAGAQIALMVSAMKTLHRMLSAQAFAELEANLFRAEGVDGILHRHWQSGEILATNESPHTPRRLQEGRTSRAVLHRVLMRDVPSGLVEYNKKVVAVETFTAATGRQTASIRFDDGAEVEADLVVAADGLYSKIRRQYLPNTPVTYKGNVAYRINFPAARLAGREELLKTSSSFRKGDSIVILSPLEPGVYSFAAFLPEPAELALSLRWEHNMGAAGVDRLKQKLAGWNPLVQEVLGVLDSVDAYPLHTAPWLEHMIRDDCVAFVGDAAHPTAGGWGTGSAFSLGDVWALYRSLHRSHTSHPPLTMSNSGEELTSSPGTFNIPYALHLFNETRRHFLQRVERQFRYDALDTGYFAKAVDHYEVYVKRYKQVYTVNWWILEHDVDLRWQEVENEERHLYTARKGVN